MHYTIGIDMGGTNTAAGVVEAGGRLVARRSVRTATGCAPETNCAQLAHAAQMALADAGLSQSDILGVGIGCPAPVGPDAGRLPFCTNLPQLSGYPIKDAVEAALGLPVLLENDANAAAWGEYRAGALRGYPDALAVTLGTGVGSGILLGGRIFRGRGGAGGELGHMVIERQGRTCSCGRRGCWETYASKRGLVETTRQFMAANPKSQMWRMLGSHISGRLAFDAMRAGDKTGAAAVDAYLDDLACGLLNCINIFQTQAICLAGGISGEGEFLLRPLREKLAGSIAGRSGQPPVHLCCAALGGDAGIIGAALLIPA